MRLSVTIGKSLGLFLRFAFLKPLGWTFRGVFRYLLFPLYSRYTRIKQKIKFHPRLVGIRSFGHFTNRYAVYMSLAVLGVFGLGTNLFARTIRPDEVGQQAPWNTIVLGDDTLIVEAGPGKAPTSSGVEVAAVGGPALAEVLPDVAASSVSTIETIGAVGGISEVITERDPVETYTVQGGDTVSTIGEQFGISSRTILWANGLSDADFIKPGQVLKIPSVSGYLYTVKSGDTLAGIASKYKGKEDEILEANGLPLAEALQVGQEVIIPGGEPPAPPAPVRTQFASGPTTSFSNAPAGVAATGARFIWPTPSRRVNQYFRGRLHTGLDIDGEYSSPIYAAQGGTVTYASSSRNGYGLHVVIDHGNGFTTLYAHASKIFVRGGQRVSQGQTIAMQGCTGRCSGVHLHFEIRSRGSALNPLSYY